MILMRSLPDQLFLALHMCCEYRVRLDCVGALFEKGVHLMVRSSLGCFRSFQDVAAPASVNMPSICLSFPWPRRSAASRATSSSLLDRLDSYSYLQQQLNWCKHHACVSVAVCQQLIMLRAGGAKLLNLTLHVSTTVVLPMCSVCTVKVSSGSFHHNLALKGLSFFPFFHISHLGMRMHLVHRIDCS